MDHVEVFTLLLTHAIHDTTSSIQVWPRRYLMSMMHDCTRGLAHGEDAKHDAQHAASVARAASRASVAPLSCNKCLARGARSRRRAPLCARRPPLTPPAHALHSRPPRRSEQEEQARDRALVDRVAENVMAAHDKIAQAVDALPFKDSTL